MKKNLVILSGAGISAESGLKTFRDSGGLWENHRVEDVASPEGFARNPKLVLDFYNERRRQLKNTEPNQAHFLIAALEKDFNVSIITQNVDNLHERAGSSSVLHLHGELCKARPVDHSAPIVDWLEDLSVGDLSENGIQLRTHIVWFGEEVTEMDNAIELVKTADILLIIGTSLQVYPAANLRHYVSDNCTIYIIDIGLEIALSKKENYYKMTATEGMQKLTKILQTIN